MLSFIFLTILSFFSFFTIQALAAGVTPTWLTSPFIKAASKDIITTKTGSASTPTATLPFTSPFSSIPNIGYGVAGYQGNDYLGEQMFEVNRTGITTSSFSVLVQIVQTTNIWLMKVRYIAIDKAFPHKLNSFDNVPLNYSNGPFVNISVIASVPTYYTNTINFTAQSIASGQNFTKFSTPLTNNKILLFMTSMYLDGTFDQNFAVKNPINTKITATVISTQSYVLNFTCSVELMFQKLHYSMIIFDEVDVLSSDIYQLVYQKINLPGTGGFVPIPVQFTDNLIMGLIELQTSETWTIVNFNLWFASTDSSGNQGINFPLKAPRQASPYAIRYGFTLFYLKTWSCPNNTYFNVSTDLCQNCTLANCLQCQTLAKCFICDAALNYFVNSLYLCQLCSLPNCITCLSLTNCSICDTNNSYFLNNTSETCSLCSISFCLTCLSLTQCSICDTNSNYFLNISTSVCDICTLSNCLTCLNLTACLTCDNSNSHFLNSTTQICQLCMLSYCLTCSSLSTCLICDNPNGYFLNSSSFTCSLCSLSNCLTCSSLTTCSICSQNYYLHAITLLCVQNLCGDGVFLLPEECDDGNKEDGDGCSVFCNIETNYTCEPNIIPGTRNSICFYIGEITLKVLYIEKKDNANQLEILLQIGPKYANFWKNVDFSRMVSLSNMAGFQDYFIIMNLDGTVAIIANYNSSIHNMNITVQLDPVQSGKTELSRYPPVSKDFKMVPTDNQLAIYYDNSIYQIARIAEILSYLIACSSLFFFLLGIFADKLVGVEMMAVIQISHLSLITLNSLNPVFKALANIWFVNGFNYYSLSKNYLSDPFTPHKVKGIYLFSYFIQNYNFTLILVVIPLLLSFISIMISLDVFNLSKRKDIRLFAKKCAFQYTFTALMFSGYIIGVSFFLQVFYGLKSTINLLAILSLADCSLMMTLMTIYFVLKIIKVKYFGQFVEKFLRSKINYDSQLQFSQKCQSIVYASRVSKFHYNFLIIERFVVSSSLICMMDLRFCLLVPIVIFLLFTIETIVFRPYKKLKHNIRFICNMIISIIILAIYLGYNTNIEDPLTQNKIWIYLPFLIIILLLICIIYSATFIIKSLIKKVSNNKYTYNNQQQNQWFSNQTKNYNYIPSQKRIMTNKTEQTQSIDQKTRYRQISKSIIKQEVNRKLPFEQVVNITEQYVGL